MAPPRGPIQDGLDALWSRYRNKWRRLFSLKMIAELEMRASFDVDTLSAWRIANRVPKGTVPDCPRCPDVCCAGLENVVSLRLTDVALLMDIDRTDLMARKKPNFPGYMLRSRPALAELVDSELWRSLPVMKQVGKDRICAALSPDVKCSIHPAWPSSCERFPYTLAAMRNEVIWGKRCPVDKKGPQYVERSQELFKATLHAYNLRIMDAVLLTHARKELEALGIGAWLIAKNEDPFEPRAGLPIVE
jgi:Fe-S-cluster containining protein